MTACDDYEKLKWWANMIEAADRSGCTRKQWFRENGITRDAFYYWRRKIERSSIDLKDQSDSNQMCLIELPICETNSEEKPGATIRINNMTIEVNSNVSLEFLEGLGRLLHRAI